MRSYDAEARANPLPRCDLRTDLYRLRRSPDPVTGGKTASNRCQTLALVADFGARQLRPAVCQLKHRPVFLVPEKG